MLSVTRSDKLLKEVPEYSETVTFSEYLNLSLRHKSNFKTHSIL